MFNVEYYWQKHSASAIFIWTTYTYLTLLPRPPSPNKGSQLLSTYNELGHLVLLFLTSLTVVCHVILERPLSLFQTWHTHFRLISTVRLSGSRGISSVNCIPLSATTALKFLEFARLTTSLFLILTLLDTFRSLIRHLKSNSSKSWLTFVVNFQMSHRFKSIESTIELYNFGLIWRQILFEEQTVWSFFLKTPHPPLIFSVCFLTSYIMSSEWDWVLPR